MISVILFRELRFMTARTNSGRHLKQPDAAEKPKHRKLIITLSVVLGAVLVITASVFGVLKNGELRLRKRSDGKKAQLPASDSNTFPEDADVYYRGEAYNYNDKLINILIIGVDRNKPGNNEKHQADALYLVSLDTNADRANIIAISRNTMAYVDSYDINGDYFATSKQQICLAYTYSDDERKASENTVKAVSKLLYDLPINGYYTIYMNAVSELVDAVDGVPVHIDEDMTRADYRFKNGADVVIKGSNALKYLRFRNELNAPRFERQKAFVSSFVSQAKAATLKDLTLPAKMYGRLASNTLTNVDATSAAYLASEAASASYSVRGVEGAVGSDGTYETLEVDENKLFDLSLDAFYKKQNLKGKSS